MRGQLPIGSVVPGYRIIELIGAGAGGAVYLAEQEERGERVDGRADVLATWQEWPIAEAGSRRAGQPLQLGRARWARASRGIARRQRSRG
jgi:hypothetical protein